jgi:phosphoribosylanthranilate isomerase
MTRVKICGMRRAEDIDAAAGADYLGFVVGSRSSRNLELGEARELMSITERRRVMVTSVTDPRMVIEMAAHLEPDVVQVHSPMQMRDLDLICRCFTGEVWGLVQVGGGGEVARLEAVKRCQAAVLDTMSAALGGQGLVHDWMVSRRLRVAAEPLPVILAGGLNPENVQEAILAVDPYCVDVSSGVESQGSKDPALILQFIERTKEADE